MTMLPLSGIKVIDLTTVAMGPLASHSARFSGSVR